jgi:hypothetical protein
MASPVGVGVKVRPRGTACSVGVAKGDDDEVLESGVRVASVRLPPVSVGVGVLLDVGVGVADGVDVGVAVGNPATAKMGGSFSDG